jgi:hypothetical protein
LGDMPLLPDGSLDDKGYEAQLKMLLHTLQPAGKLCGALFDSLDADESGYLEEAEGKQYMRLMDCGEEEEVDYYWRDLLRTADMNKDGKISRLEFVSYHLDGEELTADGYFDDKECEELLLARLAEMGGKVGTSDQLEGLPDDIEAVHAVLVAMKEHANLAELVDAGMRTLWNLAFKSTELAAVIMAEEAAAVDVKSGPVFATMTSWANHVGIQESACGLAWVVIHELAAREEGSSSSTAWSRIGELVCNAMQKFPSVAGVQEAGCAVIGNLAMSKQLTTTVEAHKPLVLSAMQLHPSDGHVQNAATMALLNLATN